jgi:pimeloyl-ACP methyl ester carboxylesterase
MNKMISQNRLTSLLTIVMLAASLTLVGSNSTAQAQERLPLLHDPDGNVQDVNPGPGPGSQAAGLTAPADDLDPTVLQGSGWWSSVQKDIRQSEYHVSWQNQTHLPDLQAAYQAPNRAHNLRTYFTPTGIRIIPRTTTTPTWEFGLALTRYGYVENIQPVAAAELVASANRIEYRRDAITEWYVNDERGLEQGFTIQSPPLPRISAPLLLELALNGDLTPNLTKGPSASSEKSQAIKFTTPGGVRVLRYSDLQAYDATGRQLPAHFSLSLPHIAIWVDATAAVYPITIDPLTTTPNWTAEGDQAIAWFGESVGTTGDVNGDSYADVIIGAPLYDSGEPNEGRVYVYYGSPAGLSIATDWTAESNQAGAWFGGSVSTAGDVNGDGYADIIVGASSYDDGQEDEGAIFVWYGSESGLGNNGTPDNADWSAEINQINARLGWSVSTAGDVNGDGYDDVIVGAPFYNHGSTEEGLALVYCGSAMGLSTSFDWWAESNQADAYLGSSVGTAGDVDGNGYADVIVGAPSYDNNEADEGIALVWLGSASGLGATGTPSNADWWAESDRSVDTFGSSVGTAGDVNGDGYDDVIIGAPTPYLGAGQALVYHGSATGLDLNGARPSGTPDNADWTAEGAYSTAQLGYSVGTAGDVNGDGYADVIVGAPYYEGGEGGRAYVYQGSAAGLNSTVAWTSEGDRVYGGYRISVGTAGDVNGDSYADVIVGLPLTDNDQDSEGMALVYHGLKGSDKPPIVFVHGWNSDPSTFASVPTYLQEAGYYVEEANLETSLLYTPPIKDNVPNLKDAIDRAKMVTGQPKVILVAHSMGGLVSRAYIEDPARYEGDVLQLFTFGSPHLGTPTVGTLVCNPLQPAVCQMSKLGMLIFNLQYANRASGVDYHVVSGDAPMYKTIVVRILWWKVPVIVPTFAWRNPAGWAMGLLIAGADDATVQTLSGKGLPGLFVDRKTTDEVHSALLGPRSYFIRDGAQSNSYMDCIKKTLVDHTTNTCGARLIGTASDSYSQAERSSVGLGEQQVSGEVTLSLSQHTHLMSGILLAGQTVTYAMPLEGGPTAFATSWQSGTLTVTLVDPEGQVIDEVFASDHPGVVNFQASADATVYYLLDATVGTWQVALHAEGDVPSQGTSYSTFAAFDSPLSLTFEMDQPWYAPGATATITASFSEAPTSATITATVLRADGVVDTVNLLPEGMGRYRAAYTVPDAPGFTEAHLVATGTRSDGIPFERGDRLLFQVTSSSVALSGVYSDTPQTRPEDPSLYEALSVTVGIDALISGTVGLSADLVDAGGDFVAHSMTFEDVITGTSTLTLRFRGEDIFASQRDGPYTLTDLLLTDEHDAPVVAAEAGNVYTTAAYNHRSFAPAHGHPIVSSGGPYSVDEAGSVLITAHGVDPESDPLTFAWDFDSDGTFETPGQSASFSAMGDDGPRIQPITVCVTDTGGLSATAQTTLDILNVAPTVVISHDVTIELGSTFTGTGSFVDPGPDSWTAVVNYDDGFGAQPLTLTDHTFDLGHTYTEPGVYFVTVVVTDDDGGVGTGTVIVTVRGPSPLYLPLVMRSAHSSLGR